jgi:CubicO group peptidase (beta-lactamase class C family)
MKNITIKLSFILLLFSSLQSCKKKDIEIENQEEFETYLSEEMESENIPALSVVIFKGESVLYENYLGKSNIADNTDLLTNDLFLLASISKVITATALLQLFDDGLFSLDDNINDYLPFAVVNPNDAGNITFKMLLTHTSGIADGDALDSQYYYGEDSPTDLGDFLAAYLVPGGEYYDEEQNFHDFAPGDNHEYSNVGNALIGLLVEEISGENFNTYCKLNIFQPLGMDDTFWRLDEISQTIVQPYNYVSGDYEAIGHYTFTDYPNGGLRSTGIDLFKLLTAFVNNGSSNGYQLLQANTAKSMYTPQIPDINGEVGLHMFIMNADNGLWGHDGGEQGVATIMGFNPTTNVGAIVLSNQGEANLDGIFREAYQFGTTF